jgi:CRISPR type IV-associated protein Csf1
MSQSFGDQALMANRAALHSCQGCAAVMTKECMMAAKTAGVVTAGGFTRVAKSHTFLLALADPPSEPFAFAIHNAKLQHVWWNAPVNYSRDGLVKVRYGFETLVIDRLEAIALSNAILAYEASKATTAATKHFRVLRPLSSNLKSAADAGLTAAFSRADDDAAKALRARLHQISFGTFWAIQKLLSAVRAVNAGTVEQALNIVRAGDA